MHESDTRTTQFALHRPHGQTEVHSVVSVSRRNRGASNRTYLVPWQQADDPLSDELADRYDVIRRGSSVDLMVTDVEGLHRSERFFNVGLLCSNGVVPEQLLGEINWKSSDGQLVGRCCIQPTPRLTPPDAMPIARQLLGDALAMWDPQVSKQVLHRLLAETACLDWNAADVSQRRNNDRCQRVRACLAGIHDVATTDRHSDATAAHIIGGRDVRVAAQVDFEGGPVLFGSILASFLSQFRRCNENLRLTLETKNTTHVFEGDVRQGVTTCRSR